MGDGLLHSNSYYLQHVSYKYTNFWKIIQGKTLRRGNNLMSDSGALGTGIGTAGKDSGGGITVDGLSR